MTESCYIHNFRAENEHTTSKPSKLRTSPNLYRVNPQLHPPSPGTSTTAGLSHICINRRNGGIYDVDRPMYQWHAVGQEGGMYTPGLFGLIVVLSLVLQVPVRPNTIHHTHKETWDTLHRFSTAANVSAAALRNSCGFVLPSSRQSCPLARSLSVDMCASYFQVFSSEFTHI